MLTEKKYSIKFFPSHGLDKSETRVAWACGLPGGCESDNSNLKEAGVDIQHYETVRQTHPHRVDGEEEREGDRSTSVRLVEKRHSPIGCLQAPTLLLCYSSSPLGDGESGTHAHKLPLMCFVCAKKLPFANSISLLINAITFCHCARLWC